jgi:hypothetical protein
MTEGSKEGQVKLRYEAPELLSLGETVRGVATCEYGSTPSPDWNFCIDGLEAFLECADGEGAWYECVSGEMF